MQNVFGARLRAKDRNGLDATGGRGDVRAIMPRIDKTLLATLPVPFRRLAGLWLLGLTLWLASAVALFR